MSAITEVPPAPSGSRRRSFVAQARELDLGSARIVLSLALVWVVFEVQNDHFLTAVNLTNLTLQITAIGTMSVGVVLILLLGEVDLSVGAVSGLTSALT